MSRDLRSRLDRVLGTAAGSSDAARKRQETIRDLRERLDRILAPRPAAGVGGWAAAGRGESPDIDRLVPGEFRETPHGPAFVGVRRHHRFHHQGQIPLTDFLSADRHALARIGGDERLAALDPARTLFLDTETTGLAGGTGCYAFLVGAGFFAGEEFVVEQFFMRDYSEEAAALSAFAERAAGFDFLVTFNGKTFDVSLLDTRFVMNRIGRRLAGMPHLDLLHPARRLWRRRLPDCALGTIEARILGLARIEDIPGHQIPEVYFRYLRERDARMVARVFRHNELDIVSLVALAAKAARLVAEGPASREAGPEELFALGRMHVARGEIDRAAACLSRSLAVCTDPAFLPAVQRELSLVWRRLGRLDEAAELWQAMLGGPEALFARVELAKYFEHRRHDLGEALAHVLASLARRQRLAPEVVEELEHRRARLVRRLGRAGDGDAR